MTTSRNTHLESFLTREGWGKAQRSVLAGDASNRRYDRLNDKDLGRAVLMDAPPDLCGSFSPFLDIARHLRQAKLSAPEIIAIDEEHGFLIIEDLGDDLFAKVVEQDPEAELQLYIAATDALIQMQQTRPPDDLQTYGPDAMAQTALLAIDWYLKFTSPDVSVDRDRFHQTIKGLLTEHLSAPQTLVHRDFHAENLLWLPDREGIAKVGLLDFQDAMLGDPSYDLASLLKDARRDVTPTVQQTCKTHFVERSGVDPDLFEAAYATCSAQRNLRIIGVFARLSVRDKKRHYPEFLPRVWRNLSDDLRHPALQSFGEWVFDMLPEPTPDVITKLQNSDA